MDGMKPRTRPGRYDYKRFLRDRRKLELCPKAITPPDILPRQEGDVVITCGMRFDVIDGQHVRRSVVVGGRGK